MRNVRKLWLRGGFPRSFLARSEALSLRWRQAFVRTFLERDVPQLGIRIPAEALRRFWMMLAHYHGQIWNGAEIARSLGVNERTVRHYLDVLTGTYLVRQLPPWWASCIAWAIKRSASIPTSEELATGGTSKEGIGVLNKGGVASLPLPPGERKYPRLVDHP